MEIKKQLFQIPSNPIPPPKSQAIILSQNSLIRYKLNQNITGCTIKYRSYRISNEYILLKLKNDQEQILITIVSIGQYLFKVSAIRKNYLNNVVIEINPFQKQVLEIKFEDKQNIVFDFVNNKIGKKQSKYPTYKPSLLKIHNIKPTYMIIGIQNEKDVLPYICQIIQINFRQKNSNEQIIKTTKNIKYINNISLQIILKQIGDIDLFLLISYHLILKIQNCQILIQMIDQIFNLLQCIVQKIGVYKKDLNYQQKQYRFYCVRCLVWLACNPKKQKKKQKIKDSEVIFHIFKLLSIRGIKNPIQCLQILCNVGLWKQMSSFAIYKITQKIKQQSTFIQDKGKKSQIICYFMRNVIYDFVIFYKNSQQLSDNIEQQQQYLIKHSYILKLVYDCTIQQKTQNIFDYMIFLFKILYSIIDKQRNNNRIDTLLTFEIINLIHKLLFFVRQDQFNNNTQIKIITPINKSNKFNKIKVPCSKSFQQFQNYGDNQQIVLSKIQQIVGLTHQILYKLNNELFIQKQDKNKKCIKYYDWKCDYKLNSTSNIMHSSSNILRINENSKNRIKIINQNKILALCQFIQIGLYTYNKNIFNLLTIDIQSNFNVFWDMNLFDDRISYQRIIDSLKYQQYFQKIVWDDKKINKILTKSFDFFTTDKLIKLPFQFLETIKIQDVNNIHNALLSIYLEKCQQTDTFHRQKYAQNIMYIICMIPDFVFTNTVLLRQQLSKQKRNQLTMQYIDMHLIIKELSKQSFKFVNTTKKGHPQQSYSTIFNYQDDKIKRKQSQSSQVLNLSTQLQKTVSSGSSSQKIQNNKIGNEGTNNIGQWVDTQEIKQSFIFNVNSSNVLINISTEMIKKSLQYFKLLINYSQIVTFYKISQRISNENQIKQIVKGHQTNFQININQIIQILQKNNNQIQKATQLQRHLYFIKNQIYDLSKMILNVHIFDQVNVHKINPLPIKQRKKSVTSSKIIKSYHIQQLSEIMIDKYLQQRRKCVYMMQKIWRNVQKNNKKLWQIFFKSQSKHQAIDNRCNSLKIKGLTQITAQKGEIQLPKNITIISNRNSIISQQQRKQSIQQQIQSPIFEQNTLQQQQSSQKLKQPNKILLKHQKQIAQHIYRKKQDNQFLVLYITTKYIYQGVLKCFNHYIIFTQNIVPDQAYYDTICANSKQRRTLFQIEKKRQEFKIPINQKSSLILKKYLYSDLAIEIYSENQSKFLVFRKQNKRQQFFDIYNKVKGVIRNQEQLLEAANRQMERWANGDISNFTYLMHLNDLSGRSFNDLSQYYIFPWILIDYSSAKFNKQFVNNEQCYRDLYKPIGALNPSRFEIISNRFKQSQKYWQMQCFQYGSFCSNPAIVSNYMVRIQPFSTYQYYLQSKQFDLADRIFYSIQDQFNCCYNNSGDFKQLIPQFYFFPQFLRNRNKYNFGTRQDNQVVNNVKLPKWTQYNIFDNNNNNNNNDNNNNNSNNSNNNNNNNNNNLSSSRVLKMQKKEQIRYEQNFIFKMKKCLQSQYVTKNINNWIDLIFGLYIKKSNAKQRDNLYISNIYKDERNIKSSQNQSNKQNHLVYFKQFGQMPRDLFKKKHREFNKLYHFYYHLYPNQLIKINQVCMGLLCCYQLVDNKYIVYWNNKVINIMEIKNKFNILSIPIKQQKPIQKIRIISVDINQEENKKMELLIYLKKQISHKMIVIRQITYSFWKKLQVKDQCISENGGITNSDIFEINSQGKLLVLCQGTTIKCYQFNINHINTDNSIKNTMNNNDTFSIMINKKTELKFIKKYQFLQHESKIQYIHIFLTYGLLISIDSIKNIYILKICQKQLTILYNYKLDKLSNCQQIQHVQIHQMCCIFFKTNLNRILMYNFMGDYLAGFDGNIIKQMNQKMKQKNVVKTQCKISLAMSGNIHKKPQIEIKQSHRVKGYQYNEKNTLKEVRKIEGDSEIEQKIMVFKIWNNETGQLIIGTNLGNLYRIDLFMMDDCQKMVFENIGKKQSKGVQFISVNRIGRHWQVWTVCHSQLFKIQSDDYGNAEKRNQQYKKKYVLD